jgi:signal transduction histidine kinase
MKISTKITSACLTVVACSAVGFIATVIIQRAILSERMESLVDDQAHNAAGKIVQTVYFNCLGADQRNQSQLTHDLGIAREVMGRAGQASFDTNTVAWNAVNQVTAEKSPVQLPKWLLGGSWLGQVSATNQSAPIVDEVRHLTGDHCTIFQRMNEAGDMLRVDTSVVTTSGARAVGTFIPHQNTDGSPNRVVATVLKGDTYRGRAFVVNEYHAAAYEPIWDAAKSRVIGMLYVGLSMTDMNRDIHNGITNVVVGKSGYVFVLDSKGTYAVSQCGLRDGQSVWDTQDVTGRPVMQSLIAKARQTAGGSLTNEAFAFKNPGEASARDLYVVATQFPPWDWVIGAVTYEDDYGYITLQVVSAMNSLLRWVCLTAAGMAVVGFLIAHFLSLTMTRPIREIIGRLTGAASQTAAAADEISNASQTLAHGASDQAASIEETSASLEELSSMTRRNAENAQKANDLAKQERQAADRGATDMGAMNAAMDALKTSSDDIAKIIKTIDEIAFQTNILALNAAVEAARAGEAGMGFAVVADEVRTLAQRSAQAAKETAAKIEGAISRTGQGVEISRQVSATLNEIVTKARQVDELVAEVAGASREQSHGITQINKAVGQMDKVTQANAASAEESAAAAQELNAQAAMMKQAVTELMELVGESEDRAGGPTPVARQPAFQPSHSTAGAARRASTTPAPSRAPKKPSAPPAKRAEPSLTGDFKDF